MKNRILLLILLFGVMKCASFGRPVPAEFQAPSETKGVVVVSLTKSGLGFGMYWADWYFRQVSAHENGDKMPIFTFFGSDEWTYYPHRHGMALRGKLNIVELPPGDYEFYSWSGAGPSISVGSAMTVTFTVKGGEITYLGNIDIDFGPRLFNTEYTLSVVDQQKRDFPILAKRHPNLELKNLKVSLAKITPMSQNNK